MDFGSRLSSLRKKLGITQEDMARRIGLSGNYISLLEADKKTPSDAVLRHIELLERAVDVGLFGGPTVVQVPHHGRSETRMIPVIGWAHAGDAASYDELPQSWADKIPTECRDEKAFGVRLEGDSMESGDGGLSFREGDLLVAMPSARPYSGCFVVAKFADDGVTFRRLETAGRKIILAPLNKRYDVTEHAEEDFHWIYPVWGRWSQLWNR